VVLAGHTQRHNEFVVRPLATGELAYYFDFYTANPASYYPTRYVDGYEPVPGSVGLLRPNSEVTYVDVQTGAPPPGAPDRRARPGWRTRRSASAVSGCSR
jgi:hypothetical protein